MLTRIRKWLYESLPDTVEARHHEKFRKALSGPHERLGECPACGDRNRAVIYSIYRLVEDTSDPKPDVIKLIPVICTKCGFTHLFDAQILNLG